MTRPTLAEELTSLINQAEQAYVSGPLVEPYYSAVLDFIKANPEGRVAFTAVFDAIIGVGGPPTLSAPLELLGYCMHELRWPEVKDHIDNELARARAGNDWRAIPVLLEYASSFKDDWEAASVFERFRDRR